MSYCYDVMARVFRDEIEPRLTAAGANPELSFRFSALIEAMHSANHRVPSADGRSKGDGINWDHDVSRAARELDDFVKGRADR